jgi:predicted MFS family arabinose efflux permease
MRSRSAITAVFFVNGALLASWVSRIPAISHRTGATPGLLGLALLAPAVAAMITLPWVGRVLPGRSTRSFCRFGMVGLMAAIILPALARTVPVLALALVAAGVASAMLDVAMNAQGVSIERRSPRPLLSSLHAAFSFGGFAGAGVGALAAALHVAPLPHLVGAAALFGIPGTAATVWLLPRTEEADAGAHHPKLRWRRLPRRLVMIGVAAFFCLMAEGGAADWSAKLVHDDLTGSAAAGALAFAAFSVAMAVGRLLADRLWSRWGASGLLRRSGTLAAAGFAAGIAIGTTTSALAGFAALGLGLSGVIPTLFRSSAEEPGVPTSSALAAVASLGYVGFLVGPPLIGSIAQLTTLRAACIVLVVPGVVIVMLAPSAGDPRRVASRAKSSVAY